ncbi:MAG: NAD(P)H-dependent oxidoreductase subunit E [Fusobacteriaceae bacterium]|jgi:NADH-quinone oxidoreductase subunit E/NADP-reducing hydrogenase subunit HndA|nr:NAD(P)H-dependent oxidoreductase subunit E [Fusobacteriaceae bacterium]
MICKGENVLFQELDAFISSFEEKEGELIAILHKAQSLFGYLPRELQEYIADTIGAPVAKVNGVVSFYNYFTTEPRGKHQVSVCLGTACYVRGAEKVLKELKRVLNVEVGQVTEDGLFSIDCLRCFGACMLAPVIVIDKDVHGKVLPKDVKGILEQYREKEKLHE